METHVMKDRITLGQYLATLIRGFSSLFYQNLFSIDSLSYLERDHDIEVVYHVTGKRMPILRKKLTHLIKDQNKISCFSREDVCEMGIFYGRLMEKKLNNKKINQLESELNELKKKLKRDQGNEGH